MTPGKLVTARTLHEGKKHTMAQIAEIVGVSRATLYRALAGPDTATDDPAVP